MEFQVGYRALGMPSSVRDDLVDRMSRWSTLADLRRRIEGAGDSRPIELDRPEELDGLRNLLWDWTQDGGATPQSARDLYDAVKEELHRLQPDTYP